MDKKLLDILVCPLCKGTLYYDKAAAELICRADRLAFPIRDDIPIMLEEEARVLAATEGGHAGGAGATPGLAADEEVPEP